MGEDIEKNQVSWNDHQFIKYKIMDSRWFTFDEVGGLFPLQKTIFSKLLDQSTTFAIWSTLDHLSYKWPLLLRFQENVRVAKVVLP